MLLDLRDDDAAVLADVITRWLGELSAEISHTDSPAFRRLLRERRESLRRVLQALPEAPETPQPQAAP